MKGGKDRVKSDQEGPPPPNVKRRYALQGGKYFAAPTPKKGNVGDFPVLNHP